MKINTLSLTNFKNQIVTEELSGRDLYIGPNGVGKSARIQGLGTALLGYVPGASGKRPQDTFHLATGEEMGVGLETDAFRFERSFVRKSKTKRDGAREVTISQDLAVSPSQSETTLAQKEARIGAELGNFPIMLDFGQFLSMSDADRRKFFYGLAGIEGDEWTKERVEEHLRSELLPDGLEEINPDAYRAREDILAKALVEWRDGLEPEAGVQAMLEWAKGQQKHWNAEQKNAAGAVRKLAELKTQLEETDRNITEHRAEIDRLHEELSGVQSEIARAEERRKAFEQRKARTEELRGKLVQLENEPKADLSVLDDQVAKLAGSILSADAEGTEELDEQIEALDKRTEHIRSEQARHQGKEAEIAAKVKGLRDSQTAASERGGLCVISEKIACPKDFTPFTDWVGQEVDRYSAVLKEVREDRSKLNTELAKATELRGKLTAQRKERQQASADQQRQNEKLRHQIAEVERKKATLSNEEERRSSRMADIREELGKIEATPQEDVADTSILEKQRDGLRGQIDTLKATVQEQERARTTIANMKASMIDSSTAENNHAAAKYLAEALGPKGLQGEMLVGALEPIRADVTANLETMGIAHPFFFRTESARGQEVFRFGWIDDEEREVDFSALSTGQQMIVLIALLVTILDRANPPCKVVAIDNVEALDRGNFPLVIAGLDALADRLDNIVLAGNDRLLEDGQIVPEWTVHRLGVEAGVAA